MEEKQLNFNAPLLSVRRLTSTASLATEDNKRADNFLSKKPSLPPHKSYLKSGPVRNPGAVPFMWEQIPGKPKDGSLPHQEALELPPLVPMLPPGRTVNIKQPSSVERAEDKEPETSTDMRSPQIDNLSNLLDSLSLKASLESSKQDAKEENPCDLEDSDDDAFSDALDTLSRTESFFMNCSLSGVSAIDGPELKSSRSASMDLQARDFMMDRFLPAARAMTSTETPQYISKKQPVEHGPVRSMRQVNHVDGDRRSLPVGADKQSQHYKYRSYVMQQHACDEEEEDSDEDEEEYDDTGNLTAKVCGILPRFCLKSSFCLLNPVPGMKIRNRMPMSSVGRKVSTRIKIPSPGYIGEPDHEHSWEAVYRHKLSHGLPLSGEYENGSKPTSESHQQTYWSDSQTPDGSSPYRRSPGDGISPYRNEASQSPFQEGMGFLGVPKYGKNYKADAFTMYSNGRNDDQGVLSSSGSRRGSGSSSPAIEKTLYVDSIHMLKTSNSRSSSSDVKELMSPVEKDSELLVGSEWSDQSFNIEAHLEERDQEKSLYQKDLQHKISETVDVLPLTSSQRSLGMDNTESVRCDDDLVHETKSSEYSKALVNRSLGFDKPESLEEARGNSYVNPMQSPLLPPPLPKSPSESWLCRTLPSVSSMNPSARSYLGTQFHSRKHVKTSAVDPNWETIVKTSNVQHNRSRFSEELKIPTSHPTEP